MNLIVDVGNTLTKFAVFQHNELIEKQVSTAESAFEIFSKILKMYPGLDKAIISSVAHMDEALLETIQNSLKTTVLGGDTRLPFNNLYKTPLTLGVDRMALVSAAVAQFPHANVLIIDAGTCITYDFVSLNNDYYGGAISPGLRLRYQSLHTLTAKLPLLDTAMPPFITGGTTSESIHSGVVFGVLKEIEGIIEEYRKKHEVLTIILTGGDADFLSKQLKNGIFANSNFLLQGLNYILEFNSH